MEREAYLEQVRQVWHRNGPEPFPTGRFLSKRAIARTTVARLTSVVSELRALEPPENDAADVERHYLAPLDRAAERLREFAATMPRRMKYIDWVTALDRLVWPPEDDDAHAFVVAYGLPAFWIAPGEAGSSRAN